LRWFGIDRTAKFGGIWENDITEIGYKYQMNDISAAIGICSLKEFPTTLSKRKKLLALYGELLKEITEIKQVGFPFDDGHAAWLHTIYTSEALQLRDFLRERGIESGQVHFRNDRYSVFGGRIDNCPNMDEVEDKYLVLPLHTAMSELDVHRVASAINDFFLTKNS
jgi:perosamine synthetase